MKKPMYLSISHNGISVSYKCYKLPGYGKYCSDRDDGQFCMRCKFCKAEMSAFDATRLLNRGTRKEE